MEAQTMLHDEELSGGDGLESRQPSKERNKRKVNFFRLGVTCLAMAFLAIVATVAVAKWFPHTEKSMSATETKEDAEEMIFKAMFSTNYIPANETQSLDITNLDHMINGLNTKTEKNQIQVIRAFFHPYSPSKKTKCGNLLSGNILQLDILIFLSRECVDQKINLCKTHLQNELQDIVNQMSTTPVTIQFEDNHSETINIKSCGLPELTEEEMTPKRQKVETKAEKIGVRPKLARNYPMNNVVRSGASRNTRCALCINKLGLVQMNGELSSRIQDDIQTNFMLIDSQNREYLTATVFEESTYQLNVQLDCGGQLARDSLDNPCSSSLSVVVWIDFNDNTFDDDSERRILRRAWSDNGTPTGAYQVDLRIPTIDGRMVKPGPHRMRLTVMASDEYTRECGSIGYQETRDYTINAVRRERPTIPTTTRRQVCPLTFAKIILVLMAGERGTEIRDDLPKNTLILNDPKQHHMAVTVFEHTIYLVRIQLACSTQFRTDLTLTGCNLAQDVVVSIDLNNDGRFDDEEIGSPYRWPLTSYMAEGIYDLQIHVPAINRRNIKNGPHLMRINVLPSTHYITNCGYSDYSEMREYSINIVPKIKYSALGYVPTPYAAPRDFQCVSDVGKIILVVMAGEYRTQIRDDPSTRAVININNPDEQHLSIILYEDVVYLLRLQLECTRQRSGISSKIDCTLPHDVNVWIDLNDDLTFDDTENATPYRWPIASYIPQGIYDLQLYIPTLEQRKITSGPHLMRIVVTLNEDYRKKCGNNYFTETREYNVTIVRQGTQSESINVPYIPLKDNVCSQTNAKIVLVIMTGELGTHIRDDTPMNTFLGTNQNRHHLGVTLYDNTIYRIRIQLDCDRSSSRASYDTNCNLAQDVNVWIDLNNDQTFDQTEISVSPRWPLRNSMGLGIYDYELVIPPIDGQNLRTGAHRVRIVLTPSEEYQDKCGRTDKKEVREYTFNIIPRTETRTITYEAVRAAHCSPGNLVCSVDHGAISAVKLFGEQQTEINDVTRRCSTTNNYNDRRDLVATLFDNTDYTLQVQLYCTQGIGYRYSNDRDSSLSDTHCLHKNYIYVWIDFNNDGMFDEYNEQISSTDQYDTDEHRSQYDITIRIPRIDARNYLDGQHQMRILLTQDEHNRKACYNTGYGEVRDYTIQIVSKPPY